MPLFNSFGIDNMHSKLKLWKSLYIDVSKNSVAVPPFTYITCSLLSNLQVEY